MIACQVLVGGFFAIPAVGLWWLVLTAPAGALTGGARPFAVVSAATATAVAVTLTLATIALHRARHRDGGGRGWATAALALSTAHLTAALLTAIITTAHGGDTGLAILATLLPVGTLGQARWTATITAHRAPAHRPAAHRPAARQSSSKERS